jgi:hypothetical protein
VTSSFLGDINKMISQPSSYMPPLSLVVLGYCWFKYLTMINKIVITEHGYMKLTSLIKKREVAASDIRVKKRGMFFVVVTCGQGTFNVSTLIDGISDVSQLFQKKQDANN